VHLGERARGVEPVEAGSRGSTLHLACIQQGGKCLGDVMEDALAILLHSLQLLPSLLHGARRIELTGRLEHVGVPEHELLMDRVRDRLETPRASLLEQEREEHGLEQEVTQLAEELRVVAGKRCVLVITGKGVGRGGAGAGVLRENAPRWLNLPPNRARVLAFDHAQPRDGGDGALYVLLRRQRRP